MKFARCDACSGEMPLDQVQAAILTLAIGSQSHKAEMDVCKECITGVRPAKVLPGILRSMFNKRPTGDPGEWSPTRRVVDEKPSPGKKPGPPLPMDKSAVAEVASAEGNGKK